MITKNQSDRLKKLIKAYAEDYARAYYADDQGYGESVQMAHDDVDNSKKKLDKYIKSFSEDRIQDPPY